MKTEGGGRVCLLLLAENGMDDWVGVDPLGSAVVVEGGGDGGGRGLLVGGVNGTTWFWAGEL